MQTIVVRSESLLCTHAGLGSLIITSELTGMGIFSDTPSTRAKAGERIMSDEHGPMLPRVPLTTYSEEP